MEDLSLRQLWYLCGVHCIWLQIMRQKQRLYLNGAARCFDEEPGLSDCWRVTLIAIRRAKGVADPPWHLVDLAKDINDLIHGLPVSFHHILVSANLKTESLARAGVLGPHIIFVTCSVLLFLFLFACVFWVGSLSSERNDHHGPRTSEGKDRFVCTYCSRTSTCWGDVLGSNMLLEKPESWRQGPISSFL